MKVNYNKKIFDSSELEKDDLFAKRKDAVIAYGPGLSKKKESFAFDSEKDFINWGKRNIKGLRIEAMYADIVKARREAGKNENYIKLRQIEKAKRIESDLKLLASEIGKDVHSKELFIRATQGALKTEGAIFDPAMLYTGIGFTGSMLAAGLPLPNLGWWPGFNNTISSIRVLGVCILFNGVAFTGISRVFIGVPYLQINNLAAIGFDNLASSVYLY